MIDDITGPGGDTTPKHPPLLQNNRAENTSPPPDASKLQEDVETIDLDTAEDDHDSKAPPAVKDSKPVTSKNPFKRLAVMWHKFSLRKKIVVGSVAFLILFAAGAGSFLLLRSTPVKIVTSPKKVAVKTLPKVQPVALVSKLTGLPITDPSVNSRPVTGVMIENSLPARPQSGLDQAGVVFEAVAEGGITRFLALYQDTQPTYLGPVRSARPYFVQWCMSFDCAYAHVGGSPEGLSDIQAWGVKNMDQFYNSSAYERITSRFAPHNVYTSASQLNTLEASLGYTSSVYTPWPRKSDSPSKNPTAASIDISPSSPDYASHYDYDPSTNSYKRSEGGAPHMEVDASGNQTQITPKVVIAMVIPESNGPLDSTGAYYTVYATIGSGQADIFQDGNVTIGTWQKTSNSAQITFTDSSGKPIKLNAGQTWLTAVGSAGDISYKP